MPGNFVGLGITIYGQDSAGGAAPAFNPASLFGGGETGFIYDATNLATMFQERTGALATTPSGANGPVGTLKDLSPNNNYAIAPSDAARPLSRQAAIPGTYIQPDGVDDSFAFGPAINLLYVAASVNVPAAFGFLATFMSQVLLTDQNDIRLNNGTTWRAPGNSADASDFSNGGSMTINGVNGFTFVNNSPHVFEVLAASGKSIGNLLGEAVSGRSGTQYMFRTIGISRVPSAGERANIKTWLGAAAGVVL